MSDTANPVPLNARNKWPRTGFFRGKINRNLRPGRVWRAVRLSAVETIVGDLFEQAVHQMIAVKVSLVSPAEDPLVDVHLVQVADTCAPLDMLCQGEFSEHLATRCAGSSAGESVRLECYVRGYFW